MRKASYVALTARLLISPIFAHSGVRLQGVLQAAGHKQKWQKGGRLDAERSSSVYLN